MAKVNLVGVQTLDFETKEGNTVQGLKLHLTYQDDNVMGYKADSKFISKEACKNLGITADSLSKHIGKMVDLETNISGKIVAVNPA